jgi:outer membrane murein-binding lipoprotein Lpp
MPHVIAVECESPQPTVAAMKTMQIPLMCAQRTHRRAKLHQKRIRLKIGARSQGSLSSVTVKTLADMHEAPAIRRWGMRLGLALVVAIMIGYLPGQVLRRDPRAVKLEQQLAELRAHAKDVAAANAALARDVEALRTDVGAIEDRARADLGMVYPDEVVLQVKR